MKKSNWILLAVLVVISAFLLWLWYYLGFNRVDNPLDLVLSIIWWAVVLVAVVAIWQIEKRRQERIRTIYVGEQFIFNSELGKKGYNGAEQLMTEMGETLEELKYNFDREDLPDQEKLPIRFLVRTTKYKADSDDEDKNEWEGEVCIAGEDTEQAFETREELASIINGLKAEPSAA